MKALVLAVVTVGLTSSYAIAQSPDKEFTPGPRMIRAFGEIAGAYADWGHRLGVRPLAHLSIRHSGRSRRRVKCLSSATRYNNRGDGAAREPVRSSRRER